MEWWPWMAWRFGDTNDAELNNDTKDCSTEETCRMQKHASWSDEVYRTTAACMVMLFCSLCRNMNLVQ